MFNNLKGAVLGALLAIGLGAPSMSEAATMVNFDTAVAPTASYTESGMTFTAVSGSLFEISSGFGGFGWNVPCCPGGSDVFDLTTGGLFDLLDIRIIHADAGDPITFQGYNGASLIASTTFNASASGTTLSFAGFTGLDRVRLTASGFNSDPTFDYLTYDVSAVPLPASLPILVFGLGALGLMRRRKT